ncbi:MAG: hypothetical protein IMZ44_20800 [Planctomycetes bacterium]|nr:hypothetical protein [Planctomycetota bacterium]
MAGPPQAMAPDPAGQDVGPGDRGPRPQGPPPIIGQIEAELGRPLTDKERGQVRDTAQTMHEAMKAAHAAFIHTLAGVTGLTPEKLRSILPPPPPPPEGGPMPRRPRGEQAPGDGQKPPPPPGGRRAPPPAAGQE